jgi:hypothetical protein
LPPDYEAEEDVNHGSFTFQSFVPKYSKLAVEKISTKLGANSVVSMSQSFAGGADGGNPTSVLGL